MKRKQYNQYNQIEKRWIHVNLLDKHEFMKGLTIFISIALYWTRIQIKVPVTEEVAPKE